MKKTSGQEKASNALTYFGQRIKSIKLKKAIKLLQIADQIAIHNSGVPIIWIKDITWKGHILEPKLKFDDSQFSDYEINILELVIEQYAQYSYNPLSHIKLHFTQVLAKEFKRAAYEVAYQSHLMEEN